MCLDMGTGFRQAMTAADKTASSTAAALVNFLGDVLPKKVYSDGSLEIKAAVAALQGGEGATPHATSTPYRPQSNGSIERCIGVMVQHVRAVLHKSGLPRSFWALACRHWCTSANACGKSTGDVSPWEKEVRRAIPCEAVAF